jgi:hypothetical protein
MTSRRKRPRDPAQLAKLIVDIATGEVEDRDPKPRPARVASKTSAPKVKSRARRRVVAVKD